MLLAFFLPSVGLSRLGRARKRALIDIGKGGPRDALQVLANGGVATACALAAAFTHDPRWAFAFAGAYAAATADTWATEVGTLARGRPRSMLTGRPIAAGISGGITIAGTLAECAGALWLAIVAALVIGAASSRSVIIAVAAAGIAGATADSLLGGSLQELRHCDACGRACETDPHVCGAPTRRVRGIPHLTNDAVNLLATGVGALVAFVLA